MTALGSGSEDVAVNKSQQPLTDSGAGSRGVLGRWNEGKRVQTWRARSQRIGRVLVGLVGLVVLAGLAGSVFESVAEAADARAFPAPGQMIDVGGHRLHINCVGTGTPTVVIDAGWGDSSLAWSSWVQPAAARTARVCTYDRAGMGYSEPGPLPRNAERFARELHALLSGAGVPGPYVLVGHSMGGLAVRVFAHDYAAEMAGVVLIESMSPSGAKPSTSATSTQTDSHSIVDSAITLPARTGVLRLLAGPLNQNAGLSPEVAGAYTALTVTPRHWQTWLDEGKAMPESLAQAGAVKSFGSLPLIVLSRGMTVDPDQDWQTMQTGLLELSSSSQQQFADKSGHNIELDQPEAAVGAIEAMVEQIRTQASVVAR
jgi:pimeloyl-ACP methyl ester carboxylesterase